MNGLVLCALTAAGLPSAPGVSRGEIYRKKAEGRGGEGREGKCGQDKRGNKGITWLESRWVLILSK